MYVAPISTVAPRTGAWIETGLRTYPISDISRSPLAQGRGLKQGISNGIPETEKVAPRTGAWIETISLNPKAPELKVAPRTGAWIETIGFRCESLTPVVAPRTGAWIETVMPMATMAPCRWS